ncbi:MAG: 3-hydroxybutyryl-CoA dehydrogenase [Candidatus Lernaella stagnicola]|nr:3-hydroxybutyryl-CoA dehydrogenase [Candidatus Lernaella stagnicola]
MSIQTIFVVGAGQMGHGIAQVAAGKGKTVLLHDISQELADKGKAAVSKGLDRQVKKERITAEQKDALLANIQAVSDLSLAKDADLVIEAAVENLDIKKKVFMELDQVCRPDVILATNTSSQSITAIAAATARPEKVIGMHFFNPVPVMKLIEIVRGLATSDDTYKAIYDLSLELGKTPAEVADYPGFISNRILMPMINEAVYCLYEGIADAEAIDTVMKLGMNHPMGPLTLADLIGLDTCLFIMERLYTGFSDAKYRPCPLLIKMVEAGRLGRKTGQGFYKY